MTKGQPHLRNLFARYKKWWIIGGVSTVGALLAGSIFWNVYAWHDYTVHQNAWQADIRHQAESTFAMKALSAEEKTAKTAALRQLHQTIQTDVCDRYRLLHWQQFIPDVRTRIDQCRQTIGRVVELKVRIGIVVDYLDDTAKLAAVLKELPKSAEADESAWRLAADSWAKAGEKIQKIHVANNAKNVQKTTVDRIAAIHGAWTTLIAASDAHDRQKFETAVDQLVATYSTIDQITRVSNDSLKTIADPLEKAYKNAFNLS